MIKFKENETVYIGMWKYTIHKIWAYGQITLFEPDHPDGDEQGGMTITESEAQSYLRHMPYDVPDENKVRYDTL